MRPVTVRTAALNVVAMADGHRESSEAWTGLAMVFKLVESAQARWRAANGAHLVALVRAGARFDRGLLVERAAALAA